MRVCKKCGMEKLLESFTKKVHKNKIYYSYMCKKCRNKYRRTNSQEIERSRERAKKYYLKHKEDINEKRRQGRIKITTRDLCDLFNIKETTYHSRIAKGMTAYKALTTPLQKTKTYEERASSRKASLKKYNHKRKTNEELHIKVNCSSRIRQALKHYNSDKCYRTTQLLGCTIDQLKEYLEAQFTEGMSWSNYGLYGWHIDHIRPCSSFDLTDPEQQRECFHYTNLQPLWAEDNLKKGSFYTLFHKGDSTKIINTISHNSQT